ncbi:MAG TPA: aminotransferase class V-fold PLP-dependent enzyme [Gemmataceae bacterium]|nr:aminotransferase class V-fold PLP-dependent enzyme [Gemmataceae bacterium]
MQSRRDFLQRSAVATALFGIPFERAQAAFGQNPPPLPADALYTKDPERYWAELRRQWLLAADRINLNCGSIGCSPLPVLKATIDHMLAAESFREPDYPWFGYEENRRLREVRDALAAFMNCRRDELALVRNATEGNNVVCNGLDMKAGEEALLTDQEHPGGRCCWEQKAERFGVRLNYVNLPRPPASVDEIVGRFAKAITPNTRIIVFSHITTVTGLVLPVKEICLLARKRGILTHVDGAHAIGQIPLDMRDLGCDFYVTSPHKWLCAPKGTGTLFVREELLERLWVNIATSDWRNFKDKAYRFSHIGTSNLSVMVGLKAALDFVQTIGPKRIYQRVHELATRVRKTIQGHAQLRLANASLDPFYAGLVSFEPVKGDLKRVVQECEARNIRIAGGPERIRIATHIFTQVTELNSFADAVDRALRK